jgi:hypothetical protein
MVLSGGPRPVGTPTSLATGYLREVLLCQGGSVHEARAHEERARERHVVPHELQPDRLPPVMCGVNHGQD